MPKLTRLWFAGAVLLSLLVLGGVLPVIRKYAAAEETAVRTLCNACAFELAGKSAEEEIPADKRKNCPLCTQQKLNPKFEETLCESCAKTEMQCRRCLLSLGWPEHLDRIEPVHDRIYFVSDRDGEPEVFSMSPTGDDVRQITKNEFYEAEPALSPDGRWLAFISQRKERYDLFLIDVNGKHERRLTNSEHVEATPSWFPDGEILALTLYKPLPVGGAGEPPRKLYTIRRDGLCLRQLEVKEHLVSCWNPNVSPDGSLITFAHFLAKGAPMNVYVRNDSGVVQQLTNIPHNYYPVFSPDGTKIVFASTRDGNWEIYVMDADGSNQKRLTYNKYHDSMPYWSPDGARIVFVRILENANQEIFVMNADGTEERNLTNNPRTDNMPFWR